MARGNKQSKTGKGEHKTYKGVVANPKYGVRNRTTYTEKNFQKGGSGTYHLAAYGDLATDGLKQQAQNLAKAHGMKKLKNNNTVAISSDGKRIVKVPTDG